MKQPACVFVSPWFSSCAMIVTADNQRKVLAIFFNANENAYEIVYEAIFSIAVDGHKTSLSITKQMIRFVVN